MGSFTSYYTKRLLWLNLNQDGNECNKLAKRVSILESMCKTWREKEQSHRKLPKPSISLQFSRTYVCRTEKPDLNKMRFTGRIYMEMADSGMKITSGSDQIIKTRCIQTLQLSLNINSMMIALNGTSKASTMKITPPKTNSSAKFSVT